jgi:hypothetical protein
MPSVSNGGRTYTFHIRRGFRFSPPSNVAVTAETFRHTIERTLAPSQQHGWPFGSEIAGASAYSAGNAAHISGISVHGNVLAITLEARQTISNEDSGQLAQYHSLSSSERPDGFLRRPYYVARTRMTAQSCCGTPTTTGSAAVGANHLHEATSGHRRRSREPTAGRSTICRVTSTTASLLTPGGVLQTSVLDRRARRPGRHAAVLPRADAVGRRSRLQLERPLFAMLDCGVRSTTP